MRARATRFAALLLFLSTLPACAPASLPLAAVAVTGPTEPKHNTSVIRVRTSYPGANAHVTAQTVTIPLLHQINGVEGIERMEALARNDGSVEILLGLTEDADPLQVQALVQNRIALTIPLLPVFSSEPDVAVLESKPTAGLMRIALIGESQPDLRRWADALAARLSKEKAATEVAVWPRGDSSWVSLHIDREKAEVLGVEVRDLFETIATIPDDSAESTDRLKKLTIRSRGGRDIPIAALVSFERLTGPDGIAFLATETTVKLFARPLEGATAADTAAACVRIADEESQRLQLPESFRVIDLSSANPASQLPSPPR